MQTGHFSGTSPAVEVFYPDGQLYMEGKTDKDGMFRFNPKFEKEWLVVVESTGHRDEQAINMTATGGIHMQSACESPLYLKVFAGLGIFLGYLASLYGTRVISRLENQKISDWAVGINNTAIDGNICPH